MMKILRTLSVTTLLSVCVAALMEAGSGVTVAIIVNKNNPVESIPTRQLKSLFSGETSKWPNGAKVVAMATGAATPEHKVAISFLFGMDEAAYQKYVLHANFVGTPSIAPADYGSSKVVARFVGLTPGGIGFIDAGAVTPDVKIVKIDGKGPADPGYQLAAR